LRLSISSSERLKNETLAFIAVLFFIVGGSLVWEGTQDHWVFSRNDPSMVAIRNLVANGEIVRATRRLNKIYLLSPKLLLVRTAVCGNY
jgi:hypothetical protein